VPAVTETDVMSALKQVYDPEIPVNIVDLGLIMAYISTCAGRQAGCHSRMTLTAQGCPAHVTIGENVKARVEQLPGVRTASVNVVESALTPSA
jgi:metal-sulfur cluster biosynthetic enzyme